LNDFEVMGAPSLSAAADKDGDFRNLYPTFPVIAESNPPSFENHKVWSARGPSVRGCPCHVNRVALYNFAMLLMHFHRTCA